MPPARAGAITAALERIDQLRPGRDNGASAVVQQLDTLATELEGDAAKADVRDAARLRALAGTLKGRAAGLR